MFTGAIFISDDLIVKISLLALVLRIFTKETDKKNSLYEFNFVQVGTVAKVLARALKMPRDEREVNLQNCFFMIINLCDRRSNVRVSGQMTFNFLMVPMIIMVTMVLFVMVILAVNDRQSW